MAGLADLLMKLAIGGGSCRARASARVAEGGNAMSLFGLALVPLVGLVGVASDYTRAMVARTEMQAAANATVLEMARESASLTAGLLRQKATGYFRTHYRRADLAAVELTASCGNDGASHIDIAAQGALDTHFMGVLGIDVLTIQANSSASWVGVSCVSPSPSASSFLVPES